MQHLPKHLVWYEPMHVRHRYIIIKTNSGSCFLTSFLMSPLLTPRFEFKSEHLTRVKSYLEVGAFNKFLLPLNFWEWNKAEHHTMEGQIPFLLCFSTCWPISLCTEHASGTRSYTHWEDKSLRGWLLLGMFQFFWILGHLSPWNLEFIPTERAVCSSSLFFFLSLNKTIVHSLIKNTLKNQLFIEGCPLLCFPK